MIITYTLNLPKIKRKTKLKALNLTLILLSFLAAIYFDNAIFWNVNIGIFAICGLSFDYLTASREDPMPYFVNRLTFDTNQIVVGEVVFEVKMLQDLKILINDFDGEIDKRGSTRTISNGTNNQLSFTYLEKKIQLSFYILSEAQKEQFITLFETWYKEQISFYEGTVAGKTYLLNYLNYHEIQEFKNRYKLM